MTRFNWKSNVEQVAGMLRDGKTAAQIAEKFCVSRVRADRAISYLRKIYPGIMPAPKRAKNDEVKKKALMLLMLGDSQLAVHKKLGIPRSTLGTWILKFGTAARVAQGATEVGQCDIDEYIKARAGYATYLEMAEHLGVSRAVVRRKIKALDLSSLVAERVEMMSTYGSINDDDDDDGGRAKQIIIKAKDASPLYKSGMVASIFAIASQQSATL